MSKAIEHTESEHEDTLSAISDGYVHVSSVQLSHDDIASAAAWAINKIDKLRALLSEACDSEQHFWDSLRRAYPDMEPEYEDWYEQARKEVGDD